MSDSPQLLHRWFLAIALLAAVGFAAPQISNLGSGAAAADGPVPQATTVSGATAGPLLTVTNTGTKGAIAIKGVITRSGAGSDAIVGLGSSTTVAQQGVYGQSSGPAGVGVAGYSSFPVPTKTGLTTPAPHTVALGVYGSSLNGSGIVGATYQQNVDDTLPSGIEGLDLATNPTANNGVLGLTTNGNAGVVGLGYGTGVNNPDVGASTGVTGDGPAGIAGFVEAGASPGPFAPAAVAAFPAAVSEGNATTAFDYIGYDASGNNVFTVDNAGNVTYAGTLTATAPIGNGLSAKTYVQRAARNTLDDVGEAYLRAGAAYVRLDPTFASAIDGAAPYMVFVTPGGESNQLYVTGKTASGFWVRETRGRSSSIPFDYRIVAYPKGETKQRIAVQPLPVNDGLRLQRITRKLAALRRLVVDAQLMAHQRNSP
jgi:hypothetical protein